MDFFNSSRRPTERPARQFPPWSVVVRVACFWAGYLVILIGASRVKPHLPLAWSGIVWGLISSVGLFAMTRVYLRIEKLKLEAVGLGIDRGTFGRLVAGMLIALAAYAINVGVVAVLAGGVSIVPATGGNTVNMGLAVTSIFALVIMEELGFRAYTLWTLDRGFGVWPAQLIVTAAFGLCHIAYGWSAKSVLFGVVPCGLFMGVAARVSNGLAMPVGLHAGLNLAQWALSQTGKGPWALSVSDTVQDRVNNWSNEIGAITILLSTWVLWRFFGRTRRRPSREEHSALSSLQ